MKFLDSVSKFLCVTWAAIKPIVTFPSFWTVVAVGLGAWFTMRVYFKQQRISRVQRIYYEDSLLALLKCLDGAFDTVIENQLHFERAIEIAKNGINRNEVTSTTTKQLYEIVEKMKLPLRTEQSKEGILTALFGEYGYVIGQWLSKYNMDLTFHCVFVRSCIINLAAELDKDSKNPFDVIKVARVAVENAFSMVRRHQIFLHFFNQLVLRIGMLDFKSRDSLVRSIKDNEDIYSVLAKLDESFKILFGYFKLEERIFISYLKTEDGSRFRLKFDDEKVVVEKINDDEKNMLKKPSFVKDDRLINILKATLGDGKEMLYSQYQFILAGKYVFEKPLSYDEINSF